MVKKVKPNVVAGGSAIGLGNNLFYMRGRTHKQGGINVGKNPRTGIEVENGEVMQITPNNIRVFSAQPIFNGISPANALLMGGNPNSIFNAQELWKQEHRVNDDGTKFKDGGNTSSKEIISVPNVQYRKLGKKWKELVNSVAKRIGISENDIEGYFNSGRLTPAIGAYYSIKNNGRIRRNDSPTVDESEKINNKINQTIYGNVKKTSSIPQTGKPNMKYAIPYLIDKEIKINGVGRMPINALDSLAKYASITGISLQEALGLAGRETKGGANPFENTDGTKEENRALLNGNYFREFGFIPAEYLVRDFEYNREGHSVDRNIPPLQHAFQYYKSGKYNSNDKSHSTDVLNTGRIMLNDEDVKNWINNSEYTKNLRINKKYGGIHIKPSKRGTFTAAAKRHNMGVQEFARTVLNNKANYSTAMVKKANFARNASKWHKKEFGGDMTKQYFITPNNIYKLGGDVRPKALYGKEDEIIKLKIDDKGNTYYVVGNKEFNSRSKAINYISDIANSGINPYEYFSSFNNSKVKDNTTKPTGYRTNTIGFIDQLTGVPTISPNAEIILPEQQTPTQPTQPTQSTQPATPQRSQYSTIRIDTSGRPTRGLGVTPLRPYDGRSIETQAQTPASGSQSPSTWGQRRTTRSSVHTTPIIPIDYDSIDSQINESNQRILRESLYPTLEPLAPITSPGAVTPQTIVDNNRRSPVRLRENGINIRNGADWLGLGINLAGNLASSLINRSAIKRLNYGDAPIPLSAQKLKTEINVNPQVDQIRENVAGQERLIADNTADSRVALARRQRVRNLGTEQFQSLMGQKENMKTQLINRDRLNRQGIDAQNVTQYNQWRRGLYDFNNRKIEMNAENNVVGINNAAEDIIGERGIIARKEARNRDILNAALIAATSPNAQNVIGSKEFAKFLEQLGYTGDFSLLRKRLNIG